MFSAVVPAKSNRLDPWESDQELDQKRNESGRIVQPVAGIWTDLLWLGPAESDVFCCLVLGADCRFA